MKRNPSSKRRRSSAKSVLRLPDLEHTKAAVWNSLDSTSAKRGYCHAIDEFVDSHCSEPRVAFNRIVVLGYRSHLLLADNASSQKPRMESARQGKLRPLHFSGGASVLANPSDEECDVVLLFVWIELANVGDNRVNQS